MSSIRNQALSLFFIAAFISGGCTKALVEDNKYADDNLYMRDVLHRVLTSWSGTSDLNVPVVVDREYVQVDGRSISIRPIAENKASRNGNNYLGARFEVTIDGKLQPQLTFGAVGVDDRLVNVRDATVINWYYSFGKALFDAIADASSGIKYEGYSVYEGSTQIRGAAAENFSSGIKRPRAVLDKLSALLPQQEGDLHVLVFALRIENGRMRDGECRIDGRVNSKMCELLKDFSWPRAASRYMYKQAYVLK